MAHEIGLDKNTENTEKNTLCIVVVIHTYHIQDTVLYPILFFFS